MPSYTENALTAAINAVNTGTPLRRAARDYSIQKLLYGTDAPADSLESMRIRPNRSYHLFKKAG